jgi:hypothetical protein
MSSLKSSGTVINQQGIGATVGRLRSSCCSLSAYQGHAYIVEIRPRSSRSSQVRLVG